MQRRSPKRCGAPEIVIHQLTDLPPNLDPAQMAEARVRNARMHREGTATLVAAARATGTGRLIAQSIAWGYAPGRQLPFAEEAPLDVGAEGGAGVSVAGVTRSVHVDAATFAVRLAIDHGAQGAYNIADPGREGAIDKAVSEIGWRPDYRLDER